MSNVGVLDVWFLAYIWDYAVSQRLLTSLTGSICSKDKILALSGSILVTSKSSWPYISKVTQTSGLFSLKGISELLVVNVRSEGNMMKVKWFQKEAFISTKRVRWEAGWFWTVMDFAIIVHFFWVLRQKPSLILKAFLFLSWINATDLNGVNHRARGLMINFFMPNCILCQ